jgi:hypothetical protein
MKKNIYVAGASAQIEKIETLMDKLQVSGWTITFDWTVPVREVGNASPDDPEIRRSAALADLQGVADANVVWLVQPDATSTSTGAWVELGAAITRREIYRMIAAAGTYDWNIPLKNVVIVVSGSSKKCIFSDLADYRYESNDDALDFIVKDLGRTADE